jgi:hypothetical protein
VATENQGNDLVVQIGGDVSGFEAAADSAVKHLDALEKKVVAGTQEIDKRTEALARADAKYTEQLKRRYDPVYAAQQRYIKELENIRRAEQLGALNAEQTEAALQRAFAQRTAAIQRMVAANSTLEASNAAVARSSRGMGASIQNAAFQFGDFAVQVASGSGVIRPLIQQGTQLVSAFGPWGAVIGAVGAAAGALAVQFLDAEDATGKWDETQKNFNATLEKTNSLLLSQIGSATARQRQLVSQTQGDLQKSIQENTDFIVSAEQEAERLRVRFSGTPGTDKFAREAARTIADLEEKIAQARANIERAVNDFAALENAGAAGRGLDDAAAAAAQQDKDRLAAQKRGAEVVKYLQDKQARAADELARKEEQRIKRIQQGDNEAAAQQDRDRMAAMKRGEEIIKQDDERARKFENYLTGLEKQNQLLGVSAEQRRLENALIEAQERKGAALTEAERRRVEAAQQVGEAYRRQQQVAEELERSFERAFDRIGSAITTMFVEGKASALDFRNVALAVVGEIAQEFIKLATINPLKNALFGTNSPTLGSGGGLFSGLGNLFGGGGGGFGTGSGFGNMDYGLFFHGGGIVGADRVRMSPVANDTFTRAPRFHSGLMPDEFPAILQKGEGVFTPAQMKALGGSKIEIIDQRGMNAPPIEQEVMTAGRVRLLIREAAPSIVKASVSEMENRQRRGTRA